MRRWAFRRGAISARLLLDFAIERGLPAEGCLRGTGIDSAEHLVHPDAEIASWQELRIIRNLITATGPEPGLGVRAALNYRAATYGPLGLAAITSPTGRAAVELGLRLGVLAFGFCRQALDVGTRNSAITVEAAHLPEDLARFLLERDAAAWVVLASDVLPGGDGVRRVEFGFAGAAHRPVYRKLLPCDVTFSGDRTAVVIDNRQLDRPLPQANRVLRQHYVRQCSALAERRRAGNGICGQVSGVLRAAEDCVPGFARVARDLQIGQRTLRRKLAAEGTSYRELADEVRRERAENLLAAGRLSVEQIARRLGYSEAAAFARAFRRWNGGSPAAYRSRQRRDGSQE